MGRLSLKDALKKYIKGMQPININVSNVQVMPNELLKGRNAVVTGAGSGIGKAISAAMLNSGAVVVGLGRNNEKLQKVADELGDKYIPFACDVSEVDNLATRVAEIARQFENGHIDILVNCAGTKTGNDEIFFKTKPEDFDMVINTNLKAPFFWCQQVAQHMISNSIRGHIVNIISIKGFIGEASPYSVSKWGCTSLTKGLARMLAPKGIVVNGIAPGGTKTDMAHLKDDSYLHLATPSMRLADPNEIANIAVFLASDMGSNIIGDVIVCDGGQMLQYGNNRV
jgi:3-oxoacyl-[acyl-carrier protein] reductase